MEGAPGRPEGLPDESSADRGCDGRAAGARLRWLGVEPHIAGRREPHGNGLGRVRWVVERTISWLKGLRRTRVRYDRPAVIRDARMSVAAGAIRYCILRDELPLAA